MVQINHIALGLQKTIIISLTQEKQMLLKRQQVQMDRLSKDNHSEKTNEIKSLTQDHANNPWFVTAHSATRIDMLNKFCVHANIYKMNF